MKFALNFAFYIFSMPSQPSTQQNTTPDKFLNLILEEAARSHASDVHLEPLVDSLRVRFRVDGSLQERYRQPLTDAEQLVTRIKAISDLDIASHLPQDGHFEFSVELKESAAEGAGASANGAVPGLSKPPSQLAHALTSLFSGNGEQQEGEQGSAWQQQPPETKQKMESPASASINVLNVRVSVFPTVYGEAVVFRLLNRNDMLIPLAKLGMAAEDLATMRDIIFHNYGMVLLLNRPVSN